MHREICVIYPERDCRHGGRNACRRCPYRPSNQKRPLDWCREGSHLWSANYGQKDDGLACSRVGCTARRATATYEDHTVVSGGQVF